MRAPRFDESVAARFLQEFADLDGLCADRELRTSELLAANDFYGIATLLKDYAGADRSQPIKACIPHGIVLNDDRLMPYEVEARLPAALVYPEYRDDVYLTNSEMHVIPFASPFVYADALVGDQGERQGTLFFPAHSTHRVTAESDYAALADRLVDWPVDRGPLRVMIYWKDFILGHHLPFVERGLKVVSAGHMYDPDFLLRLAYLLRTNRHVAGNGIGSHLFYAIHAGCTAEYFEHEYRPSGNPEHLVHDAPVLGAAREREVAYLKDLFESRLDAATEQQRVTTAYYLRMSALMSPDAMGSVFAWLRRLDSVGRVATVDPLAKRIGVRPPVSPPVVPMLARRNLTALERIGRRWLESAIRVLRRMFPFLRRVSRRGIDRT